MPAGLRNVPVHRLMDTVISGVQNYDAYLSDIVCYSDTWQETETLITGP